MAVQHNHAHIETATLAFLRDASLCLLCGIRPSFPRRYHCLVEQLGAGPGPAGPLVAAADTELPRCLECGAPGIASEGAAEGEGEGEGEASAGACTLLVCAPPTATATVRTLYRLVTVCAFRLSHSKSGSN